MLKYFLPSDYANSIYDINLNQLIEKGIKGIITDLDNTLIEWDRPNATPELIDWFKKVEAKGLLVTIISNNNQERVGTFANPLSLPFIYDARKPMSKSFKRALVEMDLHPSEVVVVGDQLVTDVFGGNRLGLHTILVTPVANSDGFWTKFNRRIERFLLGRMKRKGMVYWEDKHE
ncbi:YqeG family HAD IIIA-type phosphatase [Pueribacillus sp. YX66]|uniref:YqeG family HAD IIIA-type phosphatase n=1 Tax=Pueribacillus sp. YX66 TaxID=3229242 RepID=UPI00358CF40D